MVKVTITQLAHSVVETQFGQKNKVSIKTDVHGDKTLSAFDDKGWIAKRIQQGWTGDIIVEQKGDFLNFRLPTKTDMLEERVIRLEAFTGINKSMVGQVSNMPQTGLAQSAPPHTAAPTMYTTTAPTPRTVPGIPQMEYPQQEDINPDDIPF